jgi:hypothetical protein
MIPGKTYLKKFDDDGERACVRAAVCSTGAAGQASEASKRGNQARQPSEASKSPKPLKIAVVCQKVEIPAGNNLPPTSNEISISHGWTNYLVQHRKLLRVAGVVPTGCRISLFGWPGVFGGRVWDSNGSIDGFHRGKLDMTGCPRHYVL